MDAGVFLCGVCMCMCMLCDKLRTLMYMLSWNIHFIILTIYSAMNTSPCHYIFFYNFILIISPAYCKQNKALCYSVHKFRNIKKKQNHGFVFIFWDFFCPFLISFNRAVYMWEAIFVRIMIWHALTLPGVYSKQGIGCFVVLNVRRDLILFLTIHPWEMGLY